MKLNRKWAKWSNAYDSNWRYRQLKMNWDQQQIESIEKQMKEHIKCYKRIENETNWECAPFSLAFVGTIVVISLNFFFFSLLIITLYKIFIFARCYLRIIKQDIFNANMYYDSFFCLGLNHLNIFSQLIGWVLWRNFSFVFLVRNCWHCV